MEELTNCVMACIADGLVNGTGSSQGTGVLNGITWGDTNAFTFHKTNGLKYADVVKVVAALKRGYASGACWAMNNAALYNLFYSMVDSNGRPIFIADPKAEGIGKILGFPVVVDDYLPAKLSCSVTSTTWATICRRVSRSRLPEKAASRAGALITVLWRLPIASPL